ncbi:hypothetical protein [Kineosporia babensis]|uniref:Uncharacterized protein n=1 Tax=Kineosporia babensis TaxID=499548 RepID=A0A9X1NAE0_9ACTN|nr:hypothetical protein [Kineosporia babensis]MCD5310475.1 hypothetical protein [Kineosporia babensis]
MVDELTEIAVLARRRHERQLRWAAVVYAVVLPLGLVGGLFVAAAQAGESVPTWLWVLGAVFGGSVALIVVLLIRRAWRRGSSSLQPLLLGGVDKQRRKAILHAVRRGRPVEARDHRIAREVAERIVSQRWLICLMPPLVLLIALSRLLAATWYPTDILVGVSVLGCLISWPFSLRSFRGARAWLAQHGSEPDTPA